MLHWLANVRRISELPELFMKLVSDSRRYRNGTRRQRQGLLRNSMSMWVAESLEPRELLSVVTVTATTDTSNDGDTSSIVALRDNPGSDGKISLREAIRAANNTGGANTINFDSQLTQVRNVNIAPREVEDTSADNSAFGITSTLTIIGATDRNWITLKGTGRQGDLRLFRVLAGGNLTLKRLTMTNWSTDTNGGVLAVDPGATVTINNCVLSNNSALSQGGAIFNGGVVSNNDNFPQSSVTLTNCTLSRNRAHDGGAYNGGGQTYGGDATFSNCILEENTAVDRGGAIALYNAGVVMTNCRLVHNSAHQGGAIAGGRIVLHHSTLIGNRAIDGGGIFTGIGGGATGGNIVQAGGPGGISVLELDNCTLTGNSAQHRGGGLYVVVVLNFHVANSRFSGNHAQQGGGIFLDSSEAQFFTKRRRPSSGNVFSSNSATATGGGIFINNGGWGIIGWTFTNNVARQGAALFNNLANVSVTDSTVVNNRSQRGTQLFNHLGIMSLTSSMVGDIARMTFLPTDNTSGTQFAAMNPGVEPSAITPPPVSAIVTAPGGIRYALNPNRLLLRQFPGCNWSVLDDLVQSFKIAPNGDCTWLNDRGDLLQSRAGAAGDLIGTLVQSYAMDRYGTVYSLSNGVGPGNFALHRALTAPLLDPVEIVEDPEMFCLNPPTEEEILQAAGLVGPAILNPRVVVEPINDRLDEITYFPNIGLARMHHCHYKGTVYYSTELNGNLQCVIYITKDHLFRVAGEVVPGSAASPPRIAAAAIMASTIATPSGANRSDNIRALWTDPDGTIYKLGGEYNGEHLIGQPPLPLVLWRLRPGGNWEPLLRVFAAEVAPDNTLFVLNTNHELQRLVPGATAWTTVARRVQSFTMTKDGTVYALDASARLRQVQQASHSTRWVLSTLDTGVRSFAVAEDGAVYDLNDRNELRKLNKRTHTFVRLQSGVSSLKQAADGTIYSLHQSGQLKRLESGGRWSTVGSAIQSFQLDADGVLYALNRGYELMRLTAGGHWSLVDVDVQSFVLAPNGLRNVYILTRHQELKRLEAGYSQRVLRTDAVSVTIDSEGIVTARDTLGRSWMYWSPFTQAILDPVEGDVFCVDPPTRDDILRLTHISDGPNVEAVFAEPTVDELDPPRWFGNFGNNIPAARLHHCHYRCTVQYTNANGPQTVVIEIDFDHLIRYASFGMEGQT